MNVSRCHAAFHVKHLLPRHTSRIRIFPTAISALRPKRALLYMAQKGTSGINVDKQLPLDSEKSKRPTDLYRFFDARGDLIYVGISGHGLRRMLQHRERQPWFDEVETIRIQRFKTRRAAEREEKYLIKLCTPRYNIHHAPTVHLLRKRLRGAGSRVAQ